MTTLGKLVVLEGADAVGKTTLAGQLREYLHESGVRSELLSFPGKEDGTLGRHIYGLYHNPGIFAVNRIFPISMQVLVTAAHIDVIESRARPALEAGKTVVLDRFWWSTWVYGSVSGVHPELLQAMVDLELLCWGGISPSLILLVDRAEPLCDQPSMVTWRRLAEKYRSLANSQASSLPVRVVRNQGPLVESVEGVMSAVISAGVL